MYILECGQDRDLLVSGTRKSLYIENGNWYAVVKSDSFIPTFEGGKDFAVKIEGIKVWKVVNEKGDYNEIMRNPENRKIPVPWSEVK